MKKPSSPERRGVSSGSMAGQRSDRAGRRDRLGKAADLGRVDRQRASRPWRWRRARAGLRPPPARASRCSRRGCRRASAAPRRGRSCGPGGRRGRRRRSGRFSQAMSGWRRIVPVAVHGASRRMASKGSGGRQSRMSAANRLGDEAEAGEIGGQPLAAGRAAISTAVTLAPAAASAAVLPPGAAQRSATRLPATSPRSFAGSAAAASCTHQAPSAIAGKVLDRPGGHRGGPSRSGARCRRASPPSLRDRGLTLRVEAGSTRWAAAIPRRGLLAIGRDPAAPEPVRRVAPGRGRGRRGSSRARAPCGGGRRWRGP